MTSDGNIWRRREGVEPSENLTAPRLVLKTSGTTGHLPSPLVKSTTYRGWIGCAGFLGEALGTIEHGRHVGFLDVNISGVHLPAFMTDRFHRHFSRNTAPCP